MHRPVDLRVPVTALAAAIAVALACVPPARRATFDRLMEGVSAPQPAIEEACQITARRCTACHDIDRVLAIHPTEPVQWQQTISRMRRMRGSGISQPDGDAILHCLVYRSFGDGGLRALDAPAAPGRDVVDEPPR
jgi:hypothetical protein